MNECAPIVYAVVARRSKSCQWWDAAAVPSVQSAAWHVPVLQQLCVINADRLVLMMRTG